LYPNGFSVGQFNKNYKTLVADVGDILKSKWSTSLKKARVPARNPLLVAKKREVKARQKA
jgi:hypothetical protein